MTKLSSGDAASSREAEWCVFGVLTKPDGDTFVARFFNLAETADAAIASRVEIERRFGNVFHPVNAVKSDTIHTCAGLET